MKEAIRVLRRHWPNAITVVAVIAVYLYFDNIESQKRQVAEKAERENTAARMQLIKQLASPVKADFGWAKQLAKDDDYRLQPLMTAELQAAWHVNQGRIVFVGRLLDVDALSDDEAIVILEHVGRPRFRERLRVKALCGRNSKEAIMAGMLESRKNRLSPNVAVTMEIRSVEKIPSSNADVEDIFLGKGLCLTAAPLVDWNPIGPHYPGRRMQ